MVLEIGFEDEALLATDTPWYLLGLALYTCGPHGCQLLHTILEIRDHSFMIVRLGGEQVERQLFSLQCTSM